jgi:hypothetical protein
VERAPGGLILGPEGKHFVSGNSFIFFFFGGGAAKLRWARGAQRPVGRGNEPKKTGARSARARTRGQNPLVAKYLRTSSYIKKPFLVYDFATDPI